MSSSVGLPNITSLDRPAISEGEGFIQLLPRVVSMLFIMPSSDWWSVVWGVFAHLAMMHGGVNDIMGFARRQRVDMVPITLMV